MSCDPCNEKEGGGEGDEVEREEPAGSGERSVYVGETYRSSFERGSEHISSYSNRSETSHMWKHHSSKHREEEEISFSMKVIKQHRTSFSRQTHEADLIEMMDSGEILNSKGGFNRCSIPRLSVMVGDKEHEETQAREVLSDREVEAVFTETGRRSRLRERETSQAPSSKRLNTRRETSQDPPSQAYGSTEAEKSKTELQSRKIPFNFNFNFPSNSKSKNTEKNNGHQRGRGLRLRNGSKVTRGQPHEKRDLNFYFSRRDDTKLRLRRTEGS